MRLRHLLARLHDAVVGRRTVDDPWARVPAALPPAAFGPGSVRDFAWYFEGESLVAVESLDGLCGWLAECEYVHDPELFHDADFWQHPRTFERLRKGDCEDHAIWAWRTLVRLGYDAELVCGEWDVTRGDAARHAWVLFRDGGREYVLEAVAGRRDAMVRPLDEVRARYRPHVAVNARLETTTFAGLALAPPDDGPTSAASSAAGGPRPTSGRGPGSPRAPA